VRACSGRVDATIGVRCDQFQFNIRRRRPSCACTRRAKFGDDLSSFRQDRRVANQERNGRVGLEGGWDGIGIRGVAPTRKADKHLGSVDSA